jgi:hypothetical protein
MMQQKYIRPGFQDQSHNQMQPKPLPPSICTRSHQPLPLKAVDIFIDDLIGMVQGTPSKRLATHQTVFEAIDAVLWPLTLTDNCHHKEPILVKKLLKGIACWTTCKIVLGWILDTLQCTIELPPHCLECLQTILDSIHPQQKRTS